MKYISLMKYISFFFLFLIFHLSHNAIALTTASLPEKIQVIGIEDEVSLQNITKKKPVLIVVGSHGSLIIINELPIAWLKRHWSIDAVQFISVAAVGKAPWPIKKWIIPGKLEELKQKRDELLKEKVPDIDKSPVILDFDGSFAKGLGVDKLGKSGFAAFVIVHDGTVKEVYKGQLNTSSSTKDAKKALLEKEALAIIDASQQDMKQ